MPAPSPNAVPSFSHVGRTAVRNVVIGLIAFLTVVDLFAAQAILPSLTRAYGVAPAAMGLAVNASTLGMAVAGLATAAFSHRIELRTGIVASLVLLAVPTTLLAFAPDLPTFAALRVGQGLCMASAFSLTLTYLGERCSAADVAGAFAAYITGNVASNLVGRFLAAAVADHLGLSATFLSLTLLNLTGAALVAATLTRVDHRMGDGRRSTSPLAAWREHLRHPALAAAFAIGFCILFAFIGTFTYVNFVLVRAPIALSPMSLGLVYLVFLPSILTTPAAGSVVRRHGTPRTLWGALALTGLALPLLLLPSLAAVLLGLAVVAIGTFFAQAVATGFVARAASDRGAASGLYLASYFLGGLVGTAVLGRAFDGLGWAACVAGVGLALGVAALLSNRLQG